MTALKRCARCELEVPFWRFQSMRGYRDGLGSYCKSCRNELNRLKYASDPEYKARKRANKREWRAANLAHARNESRRWMMENSARAQMHHASRKAAKLQATPTWANKEKIAEFYEAADFLGMVTGIWHEVDHIVPLRGKTVCGLHWEGNLQVLTATENRSKNNLRWPDMPT